MLVAPSILSADFGNLNKDIKNICDNGGDLIHVDIMDGHFVQNLTIGPMIVECISNVATKPMDIHLMVENNAFFIDLYGKFKPEFMSFHTEREKNSFILIEKIRSKGIKPAIAVKPMTPIEDITKFVPYVDMVLMMSVEPGFGGQKFRPEVIDRIKELNTIIKEENPKCLIEVDGGVNDTNAAILKENGVNILVSGSYIFKHPQGVNEAINRLRQDIS